MVLGEYLRAARGAQPTVRRQAAGTSCKQQKGSQKVTNIDPPGRTRFLMGSEESFGTQSVECTSFSGFKTSSLYSKSYLKS
jgi:hypothetical protein